MESVLQTLDWWVLGLYFAALIAVAVWVVLQKNKNTEVYKFHLSGNRTGIKKRAVKQTMYNLWKILNKQ